MSAKKAGGEQAEQLPANLTHQLAYYLWHDILGNQGSFGDAFGDINFKRRFLANAKTVLKDGADLETLKLALRIMRDDGKSPQSPQMAIDWTRPKSGGLSYYQVAQGEMEKLNQQPPVWDTFAYEEWKLKHDSNVQRAAEDSSIQSHR